MQCSSHGQETKLKSGEKRCGPIMSTVPVFIIVQSGF